MDKMSASKPTTSLTPEERRERRRKEHDRKIQKMIKYKIFEPVPGEKGSYRYTERFLNFWNKDKESGYYNKYVADYVLDYEDEIRRSYWESLLFQYEDEVLNKGKEHYLELSGITDSDIVSVPAVSIVLD